MPSHACRTPARRTLRRDLRRFARRYGWRAYALPLLSVITVATLLHGAHGPAAAHASSATHTGTHPTDRTPTGPPASTATRPETVEGRQATVKDYAPAATPTAAPIHISLGSDDATACAGNTYRQLIVVSIGKQHLWACQGHQQVDSIPVTTGETDNGDHTPLGSWRVQGKQRDRYLVGPGYRDYVQYWVPYDGDFGLHDASWQTMPFGSPNYKTNGSHGCVHLPTPTMAWLYGWVTVNHTVITIEA